jgi:hypothetical protein
VSNRLKNNVVPYLDVFQKHVEMVTFLYGEHNGPDTPSTLPPGVAAFGAWACGLTAALMGAWLVGPIAKAIGGADIGWELVSQINAPLLSNYALC